MKAGTRQQSAVPIKLITALGSYQKIAEEVMKDLTSSECLQAADELQKMAFYIRKRVTGTDVPFH